MFSRGFQRSGGPLITTQVTFSERELPQLARTACLPPEKRPAWHLGPEDTSPLREQAHFLPEDRRKLDRRGHEDVLWEVRLHTWYHGRLSYSAIAHDPTFMQLRVRHEAACRGSRCRPPYTFPLRGATCHPPRDTGPEPSPGAGRKESTPRGPSIWLRP